MNWTLLTWVDWAILAVVGLSTLVSLWRGFTREALSLLGWVAAFVAANLFASEVASGLAGVIGNITARYIAAWLLVFIGVLLVVGLAGMVMSQLVRATGLGPTDRLLGTLFGFTRGVVIVMVLVFLIRELLPPRDQAWLHQAQLMPHVDALMDWAQGALARFDTDSLSAMAPGSSV
ncbi:CvpA family protein [Parahaliea mediterranea]|uniref:CvpA family protein n=1 Tax=Parahaliea mediterranea TaxID=651086 RepID=A0A939DIL5_9GAMM|nr:CvpA family protein [Parahaliea mediterranea]MBN7798673.1 CvpA family protein [Parahaliea mediterranea]